jgi:hypothetical protein
MTFPRMLRIKQTTDHTSLTDITSSVRNSIGRLGLAGRVKSGQTIAITAGSRGITNIDTILRAVVDECKVLGLEPFIVPAMGSHGGATAEGQMHILKHYGITEISMGCPVRSSMEVLRIGTLKGSATFGDTELPLFCDKNAWEADYIAVVGRVKSHTDFEGEIESGLFKMMAIGLGKQKGAQLYHQAGQEYGYARVFPAVGKQFLKTARVLFGLAIVENSFQEIATVEALLPADFYEREKALLAHSKSSALKLPFENLDLLIVDEIGKEISGTGMDSAVIGRTQAQRVPKNPKIRWIFVRDLTSYSDGNALGIGMANFTTQRLVDKIDFATMRVNAITSAFTDSAKIPLTLANDKEAIGVALGLMGLTPPGKARVVRIKNTLQLTEMEVSESLLDETKSNNRLTRVSGLHPMPFDKSGNLSS